MRSEHSQDQLFFNDKLVRVYADLPRKNTCLLTGDPLGAAYLSKSYIEFKDVCLIKQADIPFNGKVG